MTMRTAFIVFIASIILLPPSASGAILRGERAQTQPRPFQLSDFIVQYALSANQVGNVYRVHLNPSILSAVRQPHMRDLAVFDADGVILPFIVREATRPYTSQQAASGQDFSGQDDVNITAPLFPLPPGKGTSVSSADSLGVTIRTGEAGEIIEIKKDGAAMQGAQEQGGRYLMDIARAFDSIAARKAGETVCILRIPLGEEGDTAASMRLYTSDNLRDWKKIAENEPLLRLWQGDEKIASRPVDLPAERLSRYLMLDITGKVAPPKNAVLTVREKAPHPVIAQDFVVLEGVMGDNPPTVLYDAAGALPATTVEFVLQTPGIYAVSVSSRAQTTDTWQQKRSVSLSFIKNDAGESRNSQLRTGTTFHRYWLLSPQDRLPPPAPLLRLSWHPKELVFVAQGRAPYVIAFGSDKKGDDPSRADLMRSVLDDTGERNVLETEMTVTMSSESAAKPATAQSGDMDAVFRYILWALLVCGALFMSCIAWSLIQKNKNKD